MRHMLVIALLAATFMALETHATPTDEAVPAPFRDPDELVGGWYHRHEMQTWLDKGANREVVESILQRIERGNGIRRDPDLVDTVIAYGPGNWVYEWSMAGDKTMKKAKKLRGDARFAAYMEALTYFTTASWPHLGNDEDKAALAKARTAYVLASKHLQRPVQRVEFAVGDTSSIGYLHLPRGRGPFPLLINSFGSDVTKEDSLGLFQKALEPAGIAMLAVDLPGIGEAAHIPLKDGSDQVLAAANRYARTLKRISGDKIFVAGTSFGGNAAASFFLNHEAAGVISICGPLHSAFNLPARAYGQLPALTIDGVKSRMGIKGGSNEALAKIIPAMSLTHHLGKRTSRKKISTPLFIFTTNRDPVAPLSDLYLLEDHATDVNKLVLDTVGHCPPRWVRAPVMRRWLEDQLR